MRRIFTCILNLLLFCSGIFSQDCPPNFPITFTTQEQIDNFAIDYPNCTKLPRLNIDSSPSETNITSLVGLSQITSVISDVSIQNNPDLTNLDGLQNLSTVGGEMIIDNNINLTNIEALESLNVDILRIRNNPNLISLEGLTNINTVTALAVLNNDALTTLAGLENFGQSDEAYRKRLEILGNDALTTLEGLNNIDSLNLFAAAHLCTYIKNL